MEEEHKVKPTIFHPDLPALLKAHKEVTTRIKAAQKTIETKTQLVKERKKKIALIERRIEITEKMASVPSAIFPPNISPFVKDLKKVTRQIKADQTTIETKLKVVRGLKEALTEIEKQIEVAKNMSSTAKQHLVRDDLKADTKVVIKKPKSKKKR